MILYYCVGGMGPNLYQMQQQAVRHYLQPGMMPQVSRPPLVPDPLGRIRIRIQKVKEAKTKPWRPDGESKIKDLQKYEEHIIGRPSISRDFP